MVLTPALSVMRGNTMLVTVASVNDQTLARHDGEEVGSLGINKLMFSLP